MRQKKYGFRSASSAACLFSFGFQTTDGDPNSMHDRGYAASREEARADFKRVEACRRSVGDTA
jgi:hypothetical protein